VNGSHFILATAGHVDHGKSSLVKALTGIDPDRLPEEKARGITIDLGFAHLDLETSVNGEKRQFHLGLVDVPGHEDFVKNMVAGVGSIDLALIVVAADDGWMPQTEEHLQILTYLGLTRAVVALTKIDLANDEQGAIRTVREKLDGSPFADAPIVPTSVTTGRGLDDLKRALIDVLLPTPPPADIGKPRLAVDRVFTLRGIGTVVTGTLTGGELRRGQTAVIQPSGKSTKIRTVQSHNEQVEFSVPGTRTALNLSDLQAGTDVQRGDVISVAGLGTATDTWDVLLEKSARAEFQGEGKSTPARPLKNGSLARLHIGSANIPVHVQLLEAKALAPGERALAQIRSDAPVFAFVGDHFILRDWSEQATQAGGTILAIDAQRRHCRTDQYRALLQSRAKALTPGSSGIPAGNSSDPLVFVATQLARDQVVKSESLLVQSRFSKSDTDRAVRQLATENKAVLVDGLIADARWWTALRKTAEDAIDTVHRTHPEHPGLQLNDLRALLQDQLPWPELFEVLVRNLTGFTQEGVAIRRATHRPGLPPHLQAAGQKLRQTLAAKPLDPPSRKELAPDPTSQQALRFLLQTGEAIALSDDIVLSADALKTAIALTTNFLRQHGPAAAGELRQALGTSRRVVIPLLEHLDKQAITRREGDKRVLRK
jgi:selenocysteine-specific elongation factor